MKSLEIFEIDNWETPIATEVQSKAVQALESGKVLFFPALPFQLNSDELKVFSPEKVDPRTKNVSYDMRKDRLAGTLCIGNEANILKEMIKRYATTTRKFLESLIPHYQPRILQAKTSFRPIEIEGRKSSYRKDDTRLHVDAFPSNPNRGKRILRVFTNINPEGKPRIWRVGEPFGEVVKAMGPRVMHPIFGVSHLLKWLKITKDYRSAYDHYMLQIHDTMKSDMDYQKNATQEEIHFPAGSSWICYTDQVSHAAMSGQYVLEQTFNLDVSSLKDQSTAPLRVLEKYFCKVLV